VCTHHLSEKIRDIRYLQKTVFLAQNAPKPFVAGLRQDPLRAYSAPPDPLAAFDGPTSKRGSGGEERGLKRRGDATHPYGKFLAMPLPWMITLWTSTLCAKFGLHRKTNFCPPPYIGLCKVVHESESATLSLFLSGGGRVVTTNSLPSAPPTSTLDATNDVVLRMRLLGGGGDNKCLRLDPISPKTSILGLNIP